MIFRCDRHALLAFLLLLTCTARIEAQSTIYVDSAASPGGDGTSWKSAFDDLQDALAAAMAGDEIWVAAGEYRPDEGTGDRTRTFQMKTDVGIYGGFAGTETMREERDWIANPTILTGDLLDNDGMGGNADNARRVVTASAVTSSAVLSGFEVRAAWAEGTYPSTNGAGIYIVNASPTIIDCHIRDNDAREGAGVEIRDGSNPYFENCVIEGNTATVVDGGGIYARVNAGLTLVDCTILNNDADDYGGGIYAFATPFTILNSTISGNTSKYGGGLISISPGSPVTITNSVVSGNMTSQRGAGLYFSSTEVTITQSTVASNGATIGAGGIHIQSQDHTVTIANSIVWHNTGTVLPLERTQVLVPEVNGFNLVTVNNSSVQGWSGTLCNGTGTNGLDPRFVDRDGADNILGTLDDDLRLAADSPCIDAGNNAYLPADIFDLDGDMDTSEPLPVDYGYLARTYDDAGVVDSGSGTGAIVDMGANERDTDSPMTGLFVGPSGGSWFDAANWANNQIPDANTDVSVTTDVIISGGSAVARSVQVYSEGSLTIGTGTLASGGAHVRPGGGFSLVDAAAEATLGSLWLSDGSAFDWVGGTLRLGPGVSRFAQAVVIGTSDAGELNLSGSALYAPSVVVPLNSILSGTATINTSVTSSGVVSPGSPTGKFLITGDYNQATSGALAIDLDGYTAGVNFDQLEILGETSIDGSLIVTPLGSFNPVIGSSQAFLITNGIAIRGDFSSKVIGDPPGNAALHLVSNQYALSLVTYDESLGTVVYVDVDAPPGGDGLSWATAFNTIKEARELAESNDSLTEIWVASGVYLPTTRYNSSNSVRVRTFLIVDDLHIYGGFDGTETDRSQRDWIANETVLSGDVGIPGDNSDNSIHVVYCGSATNADTAVLDGFTIRDGVADIDHRRGAGLYSLGRAMIRNCRFVGNRAVLEGGGARVQSGMSFINCEFIENISETDRGGGVYGANDTVFIDCIFDGNSSLTGAGSMFGEVFINCVFRNHDQNAVTIGGNVDAQFVGCLFEDNSWGGRGAAIDGSALTLVIRDSMFLNNNANRDGGAIRITQSNSILIVDTQFLGNQSAERGGGIYASSPNITMYGCAFSGNGAATGGGINVYGDSITISNSTFSRNSGTVGVGGAYMYSDGAGAFVSNSIFRENDTNGATTEATQVRLDGVALTVNYSCIQGWTGSLGGVGNFGDDPLLVDAIGPDLMPGTIDDDLRLAAGSPCIDSGDNTAVLADIFDVDDDGDTTEPFPFDLDGEARFFDDPDTDDTGNGTAPFVDMGPYEGPDDGGASQPGEYVGPSGGTWFNPEHWAGGKVPNGSTVVYIPTDVIVDQPGAVASAVQVQDGGHLFILAGSLTTGTFQVSGGGQLTMNDPSALLEVTSMSLLGTAQLNWNAGTIQITGGAWVQSSPLIFGHVGSAHLIVLNGASVTAPTVTVETLGVATVDGTFVSNVTNNGELKPGAPVGIATVSGDYVQTAGGKLNVDLGGYLPGEFDQLKIVNTTTNPQMNGTLHVELTAEFLPQIMTRSPFVNSPNRSIAGQFSILEFPTLPGGLVFVYEPAGYTHDVITTLDSVTPRLYVDDDAAPGGNGSSWATALPTVQEALLVADYFTNEVNEIWVAGGTYTPDGGTGDRSLSFEITEDWQIYGGFAGHETDISQRDIGANPTLLTGDLLGDDEANFVNYSDNSRHVIFAGYEAYRLDGFIVIGGFADGENAEGRGAGFTGYGNGAVVANSRFEANRAIGKAGGVFLDEGVITFINCEFKGNFAVSHAAGMFVETTTSLVIDSCRFEDNVSSFYGGAMWIETTNATVTNTEFIGNQAFRGGAIYTQTFAIVDFVGCQFVGNQANTGGGAVYASQGPSDFTDIAFIDCTFDSNSAENGGAATGNSPVLYQSCLFLNNSALFDGGAFSGGGPFGESPMFESCTFAGNSATQHGGAIIVSSAEIVVRNGSIVQNAAGAVGGAAYVTQGSSRLVLDGVSIEDNTAPDTPGVFNLGSVYATGSIGSGQVIDNQKRTYVGLPDDPDRIGTWTIDGTYLHNSQGGQGNSAASLFVDIAGTMPGTEFDVIDAEQGAMVLNGGALFVSFINDFQPTPGQMFHVAQTGTIQGAFDVISLSGLKFDQYADVAIDGTGVRVSVENLNGSVLFGSPSDLNIQGVPLDAVLRDFDNDGDLDLILIAEPESGQSADFIIVLLNAGNDGNGDWLGFTDGGSFLELGTAPRGVVVEDLDGDGFADIAVVTSDGNSIEVYLNDADGSGSFTFDNAYPIGGPGTDIAAADFDGDTDIDLVVIQAGSDQLRAFSNDGNGALTLVSAIATGDVPAGLALGDLDGDAVVDAIVTCRDATTGDWQVVVHPGLGGGSFGAAIAYEAQVSPGEIALGDLNLDGYLDVAFVNQGADSITVLLNTANGTGNLNAPVHIPVGEMPRSIRPFDVEGDGDLDLAIIVQNVENQFVVRLLRNDLTNQQVVFSQANDLSVTGDPRVVRTGDVDNDGLDDLVTANAATGAGPSSPTVSALVNQSTGPSGAVIEQFTVTLGSVLSGGLPELLQSDNQYLRTRSTFGFSALEPNIMLLELTAQTTGAVPSTIDFSVESRINHPNGTATIRIRNIATNQWETIGAYSIGTTETVESFSGISTTNRINAEGEVRFQVKHVVQAVFSLLGFDSSFDQIRIDVP